MTAKKIVFFNHKGGVSKTTTAYHLGWKLAEQGHKILLVDADPQCNLSFLILADKFDSFYTNEATKHQNLKDAVAPAFKGKSTPIKAVDCFVSENNPNLFLLPGHSTLSEWDSPLNFAQVATSAIPTLENLPGTYNRVIELTCEKYAIEFVLIDLNPSLSASNQNFFMLSDAFIIPTNPDPFSESAIESLGSILSGWAKWKDTNIHIFEDADYKLPKPKPKFLGTIVNNFNQRNRKASQAAQSAIDQIEQTVKTIFIEKIKKAQQSELLLPHYGDKYCIVEIPNFQGLMFKAHNIGKPVFADRKSVV